MATQINKILHTAGFNVPRIEPYRVLTDGVVVVCLQKQIDKNLLKAFNQLFLEIGQKPDIGYGSFVFTGELKKDRSFDVTIIVGPPPLFDKSQIKLP